MNFRRLAAVIPLAVCCAISVSAGELVAMPNAAANLEDMELNAKHLTGLLESRQIDVRLLRAEG